MLLTNECNLVEIINSEAVTTVLSTDTLLGPTVTNLHGLYI